MMETTASPAAQLAIERHAQTHEGAATVDERVLGRTAVLLETAEP